MWIAVSRYCSSREPSSTCTVQWQCPRMSSGAVCVCVYHGLALAPWPTLKNTMSHQGTEIRQLEFAQKMIQSDTHQGHLGWRVSGFHRQKIAKESLKGLGDVHRHRCPGNSNPIFDIRWFSFGSSWPNPGISSQCDVTMMWPYETLWNWIISHVIVANV